MPSIDRTGPPSDLDPEHRRVYRAKRKEMQTLQTWRDSDMHSLGSYVRCLQRAAEATKELAAYQEAHSTLTIEGSKGQEVAHPLLRVVREAEADAAAWAQRLLLTPEARTRADVRPKEGKGKLGL